MNHNRRSVLLLSLLAAAFAYGTLYLFGVQFSGGDVYPEYSSLRTDPRGARLLFDSLAALPGLTLVRSYLPLDLLAEDHATIILLGLDPNRFAADPDAYLHPIERLAGRGNRIVAALQPPQGATGPRTDALERAWHVKLVIDARRQRVYALHFSQAEGWKVLEAIGPKLLAIERAFGKGSVVLIAHSGDFDNASTVDASLFPLVTTAIGSNSRIVFDEQHLGIAESGSVVGLARRFHLVGLALGLALVAALVIWKNATAFPPLAARPALRLGGRTSLSGLITLLRRHIPPDRLAAICWEEWLKGNRREVSPARRHHAEAIIQDSAQNPAQQSAQDPVAAMRGIQDVLHSRGEN